MYRTEIDQSQSIIISMYIIIYVLVLARSKI